MHFSGFTLVLLPPPRETLSSSLGLNSICSVWATQLLSLLKPLFSGKPLPPLCLPLPGGPVCICSKSCLNPSSSPWWVRCAQSGCDWEKGGQTGVFPSRLMLPLVVPLWWKCGEPWKPAGKSWAPSASSGMYKPSSSILTSWTPSSSSCP